MDEMIDGAVVGQLARLLRQVGVEPTALEACRVADQKLRRRVDVVRDALLVDLPPGYDEAAAMVRAAFEDETFTGWMLWPVSEAVVDRTLASGSARSFDDALNVLALLTTRLSGEFAIRRMLDARLERTLEVAAAWTRNPDLHVRRLASEGTRSHLPWARGVPELVRRPGVTRAVVDALYTDESEYVRRSVANHVNDLARDDPDLAADIVAGWLDHPDENTPRVARHAMRTLIKKGHPRALELMGFEGSDFQVDGPSVIEHDVPVGAEVRFTARITNTGTVAARTAIDYIMYFRKARGVLRPKVFKIMSRSIAPAETVLVDTSYSFRARTTRAFHLGEHAIELQVNGRPYGRDTFRLMDPEEMS
ncbi:DNA alkylation repair protein [Actinomycetospora straminea]|uniref:3-methyladenine DNA glycosylase AlkC n=1 Tax=Actinomycetospora straminea TaxID=663607 RepID=A0ABP9E626_9PSEU|nr:DNA alkylation repair protein [Actinomycetospora straminea]MDD7932782.1 DNA alkylation repair protein [Actinomycetospora straminea]